MSERKVQLDQINYKNHIIKIGHPVRVLPTKKGGRDGFDALVKRFHGLVIENPDGTKKGRVTGIEVTDPKSGNNRILGPERIVPYLQKVEAKAAALRERKKVVPIGTAKKAGAKKETTPRLSAQDKAELSRANAAIGDALLGTPAKAAPRARRAAKEAK
jgi:hypothetical protein